MPADFNSQNRGELNRVCHSVFAVQQMRICVRRFYGADVGISLLCTVAHDLQCGHLIGFISPVAAGAKPQIAGSSY